MSTGSALLLAALGIDESSFERFVEWALTEHLMAALVAVTPDEVFGRSDGMRQFKSLLEKRTSRKWSNTDLAAIYERVRSDKAAHFRAPIEYGEYLKLIWQVPLECALCHRKPPEVILHIDHIDPASKGGRSIRENLRFLCAQENLSKSNKREVTNQWLDSL